MSLSKTLLVAVGLIFGATTIAAAAPRQSSHDTGAAYNTSIPGKAHQDHFANSNY